MHDNSGCSVALNNNGNIIAIGAWGNDSPGLNSGHVRVYENINGTWNQLGQDIDGEAHSDDFGYSVSLSSDGNRVLIGAHGDGSFDGSFRVYDDV